MDRIAFTSVTFRKRSARQVCEIARANGIEWIEWGGDVHLPPNNEQALRKIIDLQCRYGLKACSYGSYYRLGMRDYRLWETIVSVARAIGAPMIRVWQGQTSSARTDARVLEEMREETSRLAQIAAREGIGIAFEFHQNTNNDTGASSKAFLERFEHDCVGTYWQPLNDGNDLENLTAVMPRLQAVHVFYWGKNGKRYRLERGKRLWTRYVGAIRAHKGDALYILEFVKRDSARVFARDVGTLRSILEEA